MTLSDCNHLAHVIVLWQIKKIICYCTVFALFYFVFEGNVQVQGPGGLYSEGRLYGGFFLRYEFGGGGGLSLEGFIFGILRYSISKSQNFTDVYKGGGGGGTNFLPTMQASVNFRNFAWPYLRLLKTHHFPIWQLD